MSKNRVILIGLAAIVAFILLLAVLPLSATAQPEAEFDAPDTVEPGEEIEFNAKPSQGDQVTYIWVFGDGEQATGQNVNHTYDRAGEYTVTLIVTNSTGAVDSTSHQVHVEEGFSSEAAMWIIGSIVFSIVISIAFTIAPIVFILVGVYLAYKMYKHGKEHKVMEHTVPFIIAIIVASYVGMMLWFLSILPLVAHYVIWNKYKARMAELEYSEDKGSKRKKK